MTNKKPYDDDVVAKILDGMLEGIASTGTERISSRIHLRRAMAAYYRTGGTDQPDAAKSGPTTRDGKTYIVLRNGTGAVLAVYRVRPVDGILRRLKRWPSEIEEI